MRIKAGIGSIVHLTPVNEVNQGIALNERQTGICREAPCETSEMHLNSLITPDHSSSALTAVTSGQATLAYRFSNRGTTSCADPSLPLVQSSPRGNSVASSLHLSQYPDPSFDEAASNWFLLEQDASAPADVDREYERQLNYVVDAVIDEYDYQSLCADDDNTSMTPSDAQEDASAGRN
ncbi:hypothetical protein PF008_g8815 [Phytophthora fragariae]|uniref:Uncharacterized protein n=1 Tax=Phytophthora fragariae TaxID=53985 RepID=A0A6G0RYF8_9STRA|nr:hypothetical protein PF008_g8815 [Phytophthora fragariae]